MRAGAFGVAFSKEMEPAQPPPSAAHKAIPTRIRGVMRSSISQPSRGPPRERAVRYNPVQSLREATMPVHIVEYADYL